MQARPFCSYTLSLLIAASLVACGDTTVTPLDTIESADTLEPEDTATPIDTTEPVETTPVETCDDGVRNQDETGVDCGGTSCLGCSGESCFSSTECVTGLCGQGGLCQLPDGEDCEIAAACATGWCDPVTSVCVAPTCMDGHKNQDETGLDCGGPCGECDGEACSGDAGCASGFCDGESICRPATCGDRIQNNGETGLDCGGLCGACCGVFDAACPAGFACVDQGTEPATCENDATSEVWVPAGAFYMGCNSALDGNCYSNWEVEQRHVTLSAYAVDKYEVSAGDYASCASATACSYSGSTTDTGRTYQNGKDTHPINFVNWSEAAAYCGWRGKSLCTEAQWERAARGGCETVSDLGQCADLMRKYPWDAGDGSAAQEPTCTEANHKYDDGSSSVHCDPEQDTAPVAAHAAGASPYGALNMSGNVWEWTADWFAYPYEAGAVSDPTGPASGSTRVNRGGGFASIAVNLRASVRDNGSPDLATVGIGFRCCRSVR